MNVTLSKKDWLCEYQNITGAKIPLFLVANGLVLNLKRITPDNEDLSLNINLEHSRVDLVNKIITLKARPTITNSLSEDIEINITDYEVAQISLLFSNYIDMLNQQVDTQLKAKYT